MNIVANNNISPELIGGQAWFGKIADSLAEIYINPNSRYERIEKWDAHLHEAMSYKAIDRSEVSTRDLILADGHAYNEYKDPFHVAATAMWSDIQSYQNGEFANRDILSHQSCSIRFNQ
jgi:lipid A disaccharide synthetase